MFPKKLACFKWSKSNLFDIDCKLNIIVSYFYNFKNLYLVVNQIYICKLYIYK